MLAAITLLLAAQSRTRFALPCGWIDEMNNISAWQVLAVDNKPDVYADRQGVLDMRLPQVPAGWPYQYQWSGVTRDAIVDLTKYPVLVARVTKANGGSYAHLEIEELDVNGKQAWGIRGTTLLSPGLTTANVGKDHPGVRRVRMRLIVGGPNSGAAAEYSYVRFIARGDLDFITKHPDWQSVAVVR